MREVASLSLAERLHALDGATIGRLILPEAVDEFPQSIITVAKLADNQEVSHDPEELVTQVGCDFGPHQDASASLCSLLRRGTRLPIYPTQIAAEPAFAALGKGLHDLSDISADQARALLWCADVGSKAIRDAYNEPTHYINRIIKVLAARLLKTSAFTEDVAAIYRPPGEVLARYEQEGHLQPDRVLEVSTKVLAPLGLEVDEVDPQTLAATLKQLCIRLIDVPCHGRQALDDPVAAARRLIMYYHGVPNIKKREGLPSSMTIPPDLLLKLLHKSISQEDAQRIKMYHDNQIDTLELQPLEGEGWFRPQYKPRPNTRMRQRPAAQPEPSEPRLSPLERLLLDKSNFENRFKRLIEVAELGGGAPLVLDAYAEIKNDYYPDIYVTLTQKSIALHQLRQSIEGVLVKVKFPTPLHKEALYRFVGLGGRTATPIERLRGWWIARRENPRLDLYGCLAQTCQAIIDQFNIQNSEQGL